MSLSDSQKEANEKLSRLFEKKDPELRKAISKGIHQHIQKKRFERSIDVALPPNCLPETPGGKMDAETAERLKKIKEEIEKRIKKRYCRSIIADKDGAVIHHGDCGIYSAHNVCTCGLIHDLLPYPSDAKKIYPEFWDDRALDDIAQYKLGTIWPRVKKLLKMAEDPGAQEALHLMNEADAPPKPMTAEEREKFNQALLDAGWKITKAENDKD